jgi:predicted metal-dependent HD superfamily phosphohydrolase
MKVGYFTLFHNLGLMYLAFKVEECYKELHRYYHNWSHIEDMIDNIPGNYKNNKTLILAILFHDIIYDPKREDNEEKSCKFLNNLSFKKSNRSAFHVSTNA